MSKRTHNANDNNSNDIEQNIEECSKHITYYLSEYTIGYLAQEMENNSFSIPDYQRKFIWDKNKQSRFIESLILGLPIPFLFFYEEPITGQLEIVDGMQRMSTIREFINDRLVLSELERLPFLDGFKFSMFDISRQRKIRNRSIRGIILEGNTDETSRLDLFNRINTGGVFVNPAEVRRGSLSGPFSNLIQQICQDKLFIDMVPVSEAKEKAGEREELITRFFAYGDGLNDYKTVYKEFVSRFVFAYTKKMNDEMSKDTSLFNKYLERYQTTFCFIKKHFPNGLLKTKTARSITRTRFESITIGTWWAIREKGIENLQTNNFDWLDLSEYIAILRADGANVTKKVLSRINFVYEHLIK